MDQKNGFMISNRDRVLTAWQNSTNLVVEFQTYAKEIEADDKNLAAIFYDYAEDEAAHAAKFLELLQAYDK